MYDHLRCDYPLLVPGANERDYQTKDTPHQHLVEYLISRNGTLSHKDNGEWIPHPDFQGEVQFYDYNEGVWLEFSAYFFNGVIKTLSLISHKRV